jgi:hypothetical protein
VHERPRAEFRRTANVGDLHDRYVHASDSLLILGHGLKDIGGRESFIIRVGHDLVPDLIKEVGGSFDVKWASASAI